MHTNKGPTLAETISFIKKGSLTADKEVVKRHLENLLYMKSVLYLDDKNNEKHISRVNAVLDVVKKEYKKELSEEGQMEGNIHLVAQILTANKIIDTGLARLKGHIDRALPLERIQETKAPVVEAQEKAQPAVVAEATAIDVGDKPKLRETLGFLLSIIGDPLRTNNKIALHLSNLDKISRLIRRKYQDPKLQKLSESILAILAKIYGTHNENELRQHLNNSIKILKDLPQYKAILNDFETQLKTLLAAYERGEGAKDAPYFSKQTQIERFYKDFREEKNMIKKISMAELVLSGSAYKYNKELNVASLSFLRGFEKMGLELGVLLLS